LHSDSAPPSLLNQNFAATMQSIGGNPVDTEFDHVIIIPKEDEEETVSEIAMIATNSRTEALSFPESN
jgi:hypothetical protein